MPDTIYSPRGPVVADPARVDGWRPDWDREPAFWRCATTGAEVDAESKVPANGTWTAMFAVLCSSQECTAAGRRAEVVGTFDCSHVNGRPARPDVGYCRRCATLLTEVGIFETVWEVGRRG